MKMQFLFIIIIILILASVSCESQTDNFLKIEKTFYWHVGVGFRGQIKDSEYSIKDSALVGNMAIALTQINDNKYLLAFKKLAEDKKYYIIQLQDKILLEPISEPFQYFFPWDTKCGIKKNSKWKENQSEAFLVKFKPDVVLPDIIKIWAIDTKLEKIVELDPKIGHCEYIIP